eukprot:12366025-Alexandrium_andersonii.AAC.1
MFRAAMVGQCLTYIDKRIPGAGNRLQQFAVVRSGLLCGLPGGHRPRGLPPKLPLACAGGAFG